MASRRFDVIGTHNLALIFQASHLGVSTAGMGQAHRSSGHEKKTRKSSMGEPMPHPPALPTKFEMRVKRMGLTETQFLDSAELRRWCELNGNRIYNPEWLLDAWRTWLVRLQVALRSR